MKSAVSSGIHPEDASSLPNTDAELQQKASHLVDESCALAHVSITHTMHGMACTLLRLSDLDEAHRGPGHSFRDRSRVDPLVLVGLDVGFYKLRGNNPDCAA
jgi:hypothetical protein